jgi:hypothetical protein
VKLSAGTTGCGVRAIFRATRALSGCHRPRRTIESNLTTAVLGVKISYYFFAILVPFSMPLLPALQ